MNKQQVKSLLGIAQRAGKLVSGEFAIQKSVRSGNVKCIFIAEDASDNARKNYLDMCNHYKVFCVELLTRDELSMAIGKENRVAVALTDLGITKALEELIIKSK